MPSAPVAAPHGPPADLHGILESWRRRLDDAGPDDLPGAVEALLAWVADLALGALDQVDVPAWRAALAPSVLRATWTEEEATWRRVLAAVEAGEGWTPEHDWGAYAGMRRTLALLDLDPVETMVMAGCGPLPDSLLCWHDHTSAPRIVGLDRDGDACRRAGALVSSLRRDRIEIAEIDASAYDYSAADVVCVSVFVADREAVLGRVAATARPGTQVVARVPIGAGALLFAPAPDPWPAGLAVRRSTDTPSGPFGLRYVVLEVIASRKDRSRKSQESGAP